MDKNSNVRVVGFPKETYDKEWLELVVFPKRLSV
jgi:hypothetical protein